MGDSLVVAQVCHILVERMDVLGKAFIDVHWSCSDDLVQGLKESDQSRKYVKLFCEFVDLRNVR